MKISLEKLKHEILKILTENGILKKEAEIVTNEIVFAHIRGKKSHGINMIKTMIKRAQKESGTIKIEKNSDNCCFIDGGGKLGPVVAKAAMDISIEKTMKVGFSIVGVRNPSPFLTAGYNVWNTAKEHNLIAINISVAKSKVAPYGSINPIFGTNPIGFAFPTTDYPILIDMSVTNIPGVEIDQAIENKKNIPKNVAIDKDGHITTDPVKAKAGALTTFGGFKGSAIALIVELMAGAFLNEKCGLQNGEMRTMLFITLKPDLFFDINIVLKNATLLRADINNSDPLIKGKKPVLPGDKSFDLMRIAFERGVALNESEIKLLKNYGAEI